MLRLRKLLNWNALSVGQLTPRRYFQSSPVKLLIQWIQGEPIVLLLLVERFQTRTGGSFSLGFKTSIKYALLVTFFLSTSKADKIQLIKKEFKMTEEMVTQRRDTLLSPTVGGEVSVGMVAPDFQLEDESGNKQSISQHWGKQNVVIAFYPKDFTGG